MDEASVNQRSKRQKLDKSGRLSALEKFKQLKSKGVKNKYEVDEVQNVYDEVSEKDYSKKVLDRQYDDFIVDDGTGYGYVEDGREIFDDDLDDESIQKNAKSAKFEMKGPRKREREHESNKGTLTNMFMNMSKKRKAEEKVVDDDVLGDLMSELHKDTNSENYNKKVPAKNKFLTKQKDSSQEDEKLLSSLISENDKRPNSLEAEDMLYEKPKAKKVEVKSVEVLSKPLVCSYKKDNKQNNNELKILKFDDSNSDNFSGTKVTVTSLESTAPISNQKVVENISVDDYVGDISDVDFDNMEMDTSCSQQNISSLSQCTLNNSKMWQENTSSFAKDEKLVKGWEENFSSTPLQEKPAMQVDDNAIAFPTVVNSEGEKVFRFFWFDAFEDPYKQPGTAYLFGKVFIESLKEYVSCSLMVKNIPRKIYLLPRETITNSNGEAEENTMENVYEEFNEIARKNGISEFRCREVEKSYAFDRADTPAKADYLEVNFSSTSSPIDANYSGKTIEAVFGSSVNALELLLIERNIKGPCWLDIKAPLRIENQYSWCKVQVQCSLENGKTMNAVSVTSDQSSMGIPPIVIATVNVQICLDQNLQKNEVVMIGVLFHHKFHLDKAPPKPPFNKHCCLVTHPKNTPWPLHMKDKLSKITKTKVIRCETELDLLEKFLDVLQDCEPDLIIGYDCGFQFDVLMSKIFSLKVKNWSRIGKLKRPPPYIKGKINLGQIFSGRPVCDITTSAKELNLKVKSYDLASLCVAVLKKRESECKEIKPEDCRNYYNTFETLENLMQIVMGSASFIVGIVVELNILPLALQITNIAGNMLSRTLSAGRSERNEFLLLHAFHNKQYITPDKRITNKKKDSVNETSSGRKKPAYTGGLVLEPQKGLYDKLILLMDFNSLYPSIIQEYNLCFTTVPGAAYADLEELSLPESDLELGVIPTEIRKLVESRVEVKKLMKAPNLSPELKMQYDIRQLALKLTANSMYGCLGATHCRFYAKGLAALVTSKGREILQNTKSLVEKANYEVIYGDTDSIMINTNILDYDQVFTIGKDIKQKVNKMYKKVELDIDGVFKKLLLLKKKKYAAVTVAKLPNGDIKETQEMKGLDIVRRDWCNLACDIGRQVIQNLMSDQPSDTRIDNIFELLQNVSKNLREGKVPLSSLVITKQLSKNPNEYAEAKRAQLSHVLVAQRLNELGGRKWKAGDTIPFIVCEDGTNRSPTERVYHIDEFKKSNSLKVDINYYLLSQIHPVVLRLCDPIEGIDDVLLAQHLGLEGIYKSTRTIHSKEETEVPLSINENRYENCIPLKFTCFNEDCKAEIEIKGVFTEFPTGTKPTLAMCVNPECQISPWKYVHTIQNKIQMEIRRFVAKYYFGEVECENPICSKIMRKITLDTYGNFPKCYECKDGNVHRIYGETDLFNQLSYYLHLFSLNQSHYKNLKTPLSRELIAAYDTIKEFVENQIQCNAYSIVDLTKLFWYSDQESEIDPIKFEDHIKPIEVEDLNDDQEDIIEDEAE